MTQHQILVEETEFAAIPCAVYKPQHSTGELATILLYHGWGGCKENYRFFATLLAKWGYQVIVPEVPQHGVRGSLPDYYTPAGYLNFWPVVLQAVQESRAILQALIEQGRAVQDRIAVAGHSMGGMIATSSFAENETLRCLVTINSTGSWEQFEHWVRASNNAPAPTEAELAPLRALDPQNKLARLAPRPILFLHGTDDTFIPLHVQKPFHDGLAPHYEQAAAADRLRFEEVPRLNHHITMDMLDQLIGWLDTHLDS